MRITKIKIKNLYGIKEYEQDGGSVEFTGKNGAGKTSVIDAIRYALTNKSERDYIIRNGESEGEILIETDNGLRINRRPRTTQSDYKSVKQNGAEIASPEAFLREIFTPLQLNPVEFMAMSKEKQNAVILDMIEYDWSLDKIKEWFGEIPSWINYEQNILQILNDIQSEKGQYFLKRQDINREIRNKRAFIEEIGASIPVGYQVDAWEEASPGDLYKKIESIRRDNQLIEQAKNLQESRESKKRKFEAEREISKSALDTEFINRESQIDKDILRLQEQIKALETERENLGAKKADKLEIIEQTYKVDIAKFDSEIAQYSEYVGKPIQEVVELVKEVENIELMKSHINEYRRMENLQDDVEELRIKADSLTKKIEKARALPGEILADCTMPIENLTVVDGIPLVNGLPISNLSEGEKLDLCVDVSIQKPNGLKIILIDGAEKLSTELRTKLYEKCKSKGLQFIATRTTDDEYLTVIEA